MHYFQAIETSKDLQGTKFGGMSWRQSDVA